MGEFVWEWVGDRASVAEDERFAWGVCACAWVGVQTNPVECEDRAYR